MESHFKNDLSYRNVYVKGEVSDKFISDYGHLYFTLKDKRSQVPCIVYKRFIKNIPFDIENGMKLLVIANVIVYVPHGKYELDVRSVTEDGLGQLFVKYQQLKKRLQREGIFDVKHKKELPHYVQRIGVITSRGGSVIHDIIKTVTQNWPYCRVFLFPATVQGANSKTELVTQIRRADASNMDVLIVARGGGNIQDLWSYNEEEVVRAIFDCRTPVISAIGHEDNTTLSDLASDRRASTPTMAASLAIEDKNAILENIGHFNSRLMVFMSAKIEKYKKQLEYMLSKPIFVDETHVYRAKRDGFDDMCDRFDVASRELVKSNRVMLEKTTNEYVIRHPCKLQVDTSRYNLNELRNRLIDSMSKILNGNRVDMDDITNRFKFLSQKVVTSRRHELEIAESFLMSKPCQKQIELSRNNLKAVQDKLNGNIRAYMMDNRKNLKMVSNDFKNSSKNLVRSNRVMLDKITNEYVIRHPCKIQLDMLHANLNEFQNRSVEAACSTLISNRANLDNATGRFRYSALKLLTSKKHDIELAKSNISVNLYRNRIDASRNNLYLSQEKLVNQMNLNFERNERDLDLIKNNLKNLSKGILLDNARELDLIKNENVIRKPQTLYESKGLELDVIKNHKAIRNPYLMLDSHKSELGIYKEKLDNIKQVIELKKEQQRQKRRYMIVIALIVIVMVIVLLIMFGGIL